MTDIEIIRECLKRWHSFAVSFRNAGLGERVKDTKDALEALGRVAQPGFQWKPRERDESIQE